VEDRAAPRPELVCFDVDGTLITTGEAGARAWDRAFQAIHGVPADISKYSEDGMTDPTVASAVFASTIGHDPTPVELASIMGGYLDFLPSEVALSLGYRVLPGVEALLETLVGAGVLAGIVSGALEGAAHVKLARGGLNRYLAFGAFGSDTADRRELTRLAIERGTGLLGHEPDPARVLVVGDTPRDVDAAHAAGAVAVAVATGHYRTEELRDAGADVVVESLADGLPGVALDMTRVPGQ